jgi:hypothetical protein
MLCGGGPVLSRFRAPVLGKPVCCKRVCCKRFQRSLRGLVAFAELMPAHLFSLWKAAVFQLFLRVGRINNLNQPDYFSLVPNSSLEDKVD